jgi:hypothetical protein
VALINVMVRARTPEGAMGDAHEFVKRIRHRHAHGQVVGPAPAALAKLNDEVPSAVLHERRATQTDAPGAAWRRSTSGRNSNGASSWMWTR